jgi:Tfp pilus assembly protein PilO
MKKLSPAKKQQLTLAIVGTVALVSLVYFLLISPQNEQNRKLAADIKKKQEQADQIKKLIKQADETKIKAEDLSAQLSGMETDIASGDVFAWTYDTIRRFKAGYHVEIPSIGQPVSSDVDLLPDFPYKQIKFSISGSGYYYDIGKFIADLENKFPHMRVANLMVEPATGAESGAEKLSFQMEIMALVKPNS